MPRTKPLLVAGGLVALSALVSVAAAPSLPERLVTHWNAAGRPDGTMATPLALTLFPALSAALLAMFLVVPRIDPLGSNIAAFRGAYDRFVAIAVAFLFVVHVGVVAYNLGYVDDVSALVLGAVAVLLYAVGDLLPRAEPNWFVGIRTPWTLSSEVVWERTHDVGGLLFKLAAVLALGGVLFPEYTLHFVVVPLAGVALFATAYSLYLYRTLDDHEAPAAGADG